MPDALANGGVSRTRASGVGERLFLISVDTLHAILADYTPNGDVPRRGRPVRPERNAHTGLLALVVDGTNELRGSALRLTVRSAGASSLNLDVSRSDETDGLLPGQRRLLFRPDDLLAIVGFVAAGTVPPGAELLNVMVSATLQRKLGLVVKANWRDVPLDGRNAMASRDFPFAVDVIYEPYAEKAVVVFDEKGVPVRRQDAPDRAAR